MKTEQGKMILGGAVVLSLVIVGAYFLVPWDPDTFFIARSLVALVTVLAYLWHMNRVWSSIQRASQRLRYLALLGWSMLVTAASYDQAASSKPIEWYSVVGFIVTMITLAAAIASIREQYEEFGIGRRRTS